MIHSMLIDPRFLTPSLNAIARPGTVEVPAPVQALAA